MNIVIPQMDDVRSGFGKFFSGLGLIPTLVLAVVFIAFIYYAGAGIGDWFQGWRAQREIEGYKTQAAEAMKVAEAERAEKEQYKGAAAAYQQQAAQENSILVELLNERPELQNRINAASARVQAARQSNPKPVDSHILERVNALGSKLDRLYPDK